MKSLPYINYGFAALFSILGFIVIMAVYEQYDYFVGSYIYRFFQKIFGATGVKVFYYIFGILLIVLGYLFIKRI